MIVPNIYRIIGMLIAIIVILIDQITKRHMENFFSEYQYQTGHPIERVNYYFDYVLAWNKGVSFSMLNNYGQIGRYILIGAAGIICMILIRWLLKSTILYTCIGLGMIIGGAFGNIIDRIIYGAVIDFLHFHYQNWSWPAFNYADTFICVGVVIMIFERNLKSKGNFNENQ